jgi:NAD(P)-dependent dehydrogenase (short-subunit alcohol dehydrogenase family)
MVPDVKEVRALAATPLSNRLILVTGGSSGLGRAAAREFAASGAKVIILGRNEDRLAAALDSLAGGDHAMVPADLTDADTTFEVVKAAASKYGRFDGIFHAAGAYLAMAAKMTKQRHIDQMFAAAVWGAYGIARAAAHHTVLAEGGSVVFMSSVARERGHPGTIAYAGAKAAVSGIVKALAVELGPKRIRVNEIVSGTVETEMHLTTAANLPVELIEAGARRHILGFGEPADVAAAAVFLMSDASRWITGASMSVDGGYLAQ